MRSVEIRDGGAAGASLQAIDRSPARCDEPQNDVVTAVSPQETPVPRRYPPTFVPGRICECCGGGLDGNGFEDVGEWCFCGGGDG